MTHRALFYFQNSNIDYNGETYSAGLKATVEILKIIKIKGSFNLKYGEIEEIEKNNTSVQVDLSFHGKATLF